MRWRSTQDSVRLNEPTVLAIGETCAAMLVSGAVGYFYNTWWHVFFGFLIAPLLLLRTDESCERAFRIFGRSANALVEWNINFVSLLLAPLLVVGGLAVRAIATCIQFLITPMQCISAVPENWWRMVCATDFATSPEYLPLPQTASTELAPKVASIERFNRVYTIWRGLLSAILKRETPSRAGRILLAIGAGLVILTPPTIVAIAYRWSLKSTAIGWMPLLWAMKDPKPADRDWGTHLNIEWSLKKPQLVAAWSAACLAGFTLKYILWASRHELALKVEAWRIAFRQWAESAGLSTKLADSPVADAIITVIRPGAFPLWQVAAVINSILAILLWWRIREWLACYRHNAPPKAATVQRFTAVTYFVRRLLTIYVAICNGYMFYKIAQQLPVPSIGPQFFPWV